MQRAPQCHPVRPLCHHQVLHQELLYPFQWSQHLPHIGKKQTGTIAYVPFPYSRAWQTTGEHRFRWSSMWSYKCIWTTVPVLGGLTPLGYPAKNEKKSQWLITCWLLSHIDSDLFMGQLNRYLLVSILSQAVVLLHQVLFLHLPQLLQANRVTIQISAN